jgi:cytochrome P450
MSADPASPGHGMPAPALPADELGDARSDPLAFLERSCRKYGDVFRYALEGWPVVVLNDPALARQALQFDGELLTKEGTPDLMMLRPMLGQGLMTSEGAAWQASRTASQPAFGAPRVAGYVPGMWQCIEDMLDAWQSAGGTVLDMEREFNQLTMRVVGSCLFHTDLDGQQADLGQAVEMMNRCVAHFDPADLAMPQRFAAAHAQLHMLLQPIAQAAAPPDSLLGVLRTRCAHQGEQAPRMLREEIVTFLMAGHETTAKALTWAAYLLAAQPAVRARVRAEAAASLGAPMEANDRTLVALAYTWQVLQEAMRLYPPVWMMSRRALATFELGGYTIPQGTLLIVSPYFLHRHPAHWPEPLRFDPARFAKSHGERAAGAYMPFGAGNRVCIGRLFAAAEATLALARLVQRYDFFRIDDEPVVPEALVTLRPRGGLRLRVERVA